MSNAMFTPEGSIAGHRGNKAMVMLRASIVRAISGPAWIPDSGTKTKVPETRASTSRKAYSVPMSKWSSVPILGDVGEYASGVAGQVFEHPGHQGNQAGEKSR